jgi:hypothetical protein
VPQERVDGAAVGGSLPGERLGELAAADPEESGYLGVKLASSVVREDPHDGTIGRLCERPFVGRSTIERHRQPIRSPTDGERTRRPGPS